MSEFSENKEQIEQTKKTSTLFTEAEMISTVKGFVLAYIRGIITIEFATDDEYYDWANEKGKPISKIEASKRESKYRNNFNDAIMIVSGGKSATEAELSTATLYLFQKMLTLRSVQRIKGTFMESNLENRLDDLEKKLEANHDVVAELIKWLTEEAKGQ